MWFLCESCSLSRVVLQVSEKRGLAGSSRVQCPYKVLRLLDERTGKECALYLWDEWFYSTVSPGDSINVIGDFDGEGKCDVDHQNNFLIVHPDTLVAGTKVAASFGCPRRTVLDERLRSNEHATAALLGTLLHQVFQVYCSRSHARVSICRWPDADPVVASLKVKSDGSCSESSRKATFLSLPPFPNTMARAVKALLIRGSSILLASYTNSAVDNLLIKLKAQLDCTFKLLLSILNGIEFLLIGRDDEAVHEEVRESCFSGEQAFTTSLKIPSPFEARDQNAINNPVEASIIAEIVEELVNNGVDSKDIGIITPYNSQASLIQQAIPTASVEIHTIDKYQGSDKDCIIVSFVRSREKPRSSGSSLLGDWHRINVFFNFQRITKNTIKSSTSDASAGQRLMSSLVS
ncbi:hypothetical protein F2Q68_00042631 [Brassica cretica]|uniref:DNA replication ATP-dependent helicase/nuclease n=1 Tax=Brassica cretica TaxID=69181 RepID=A0A8S9MFH6_BRACR|nr:hypothetical protein F2Q68_00042631 [Brassica cretica]